MSSCSPVPKLNCQVAQNFDVLYYFHDGACYVSIAVKTQIDCKFISNYIDIHEVSYTHIFSYKERTTDDKNEVK